MLNRLLSLELRHAALVAAGTAAVLLGIASGRWGCLPTPDRTPREPPERARALDQADPGTGSGRSRHSTTPTPALDHADPGVE